MECEVFIAASMDGYIARKDGGIDWLNSFADVPGEDYGFKAFMDSVDALVMGRNTFEKVMTFGAWPYGKKPVVVLTSRGRPRGKKLPDTVSFMKGTPARVVAELEKKGMRRVYLDGGRTIQAFLRSGLVTRMIVTRIPILIGSGVPLFGRSTRDIRLRHVRTRAYASGLVQSEYLPD